MDQRPAGLGGFLEGHRPAGDLDEFRGTPEGTLLDVHLEHAGAGRLQRQAEPLGVGLRLPAGVSQGQFLALARVDIEHQPDHLQAAAIGRQPLFGVRLNPAGLA